MEITSMDMEFKITKSPSRLFQYTLQVLLVIFAVSSLQAANPILIGLEPAVIIEPDYADNEMDIALIPLSFRGNLRSNIDWRILLVNNIHLGDDTEFNELGLEFAPLYISIKKNQVRPGILHLCWHL